jgi:hypothetical protein
MLQAVRRLIQTGEAPPRLITRATPLLLSLSVRSVRIFVCVLKRRGGVCGIKADRLALVDTTVIDNRHGIIAQGRETGDKNPDSAAVA